MPRVNGDFYYIERENFFYLAGLDFYFNTKVNDQNDSVFVSTVNIKEVNLNAYGLIHGW